MFKNNETKIIGYTNKPSEEAPITLVTKYLKTDLSITYLADLGNIHILVWVIEKIVETIKMSYEEIEIT